MKTGKNTVKKPVDVCMTVRLLCLMAYQGRRCFFAGIERMAVDAERHGRLEADLETWIPPKRRAGATIFGCGVLTDVVSWEQHDRKGAVP